jgi:hypothetical protein
MRVDRGLRIADALQYSCPITTRFFSMTPRLFRRRRLPTLKAGFFCACAAAVLALASATVCQARVGETLEECTKRYGSPIGKLPDGERNIPESDSGYLFENSFPVPGTQLTLRLKIEFKNGKAWNVRYSGGVAEFMDKYRIDIMEKLRGDDSWSEPLTYQGRRFWMTATKKDLFSVFFKLGNRMILEVSSAECVAAMKRQQDAAAAAISKAPPAAEPTLPGGGATGATPGGTGEGAPEKKEGGLIQGL